MANPTNVVTNNRPESIAVAAHLTAQVGLVHTWELEGKSVRLFRSDNQIEFEIVYQFGASQRGSIPIPSGRSVEESINSLLRLDPVVDNQGKLTFKKKTAPSKLDPKQTVTYDLWAVTLIDTGSRDSLNLAKYSGHAAIIIESIETGQYVIRKAHLASHSDQLKIIKNAELLAPNACLGKIGFTPTEVRPPAQQSETCLIQKEKAQAMIEAIEYEATQPIYLNLLGNGSYLNEPICVRKFPSLLDWMKQFSQVPLNIPISSIIKWEGHGFCPRFVWFASENSFTEQVQNIRERLLQVENNAQAVDDELKSSLQLLYVIHASLDPGIYEYAVPDSCFSWAKRMMAIAGIQVQASKLESLVGIPKLEVGHAVFQLNPRDNREKDRRVAIDEKLVYPPHLKGQIDLHRFEISQTSEALASWQPCYTIFGCVLWYHMLPTKYWCAIL